MAPATPIPTGRVKVVTSGFDWSLGPDGAYLPAQMTVEVDGIPHHPAIPYDMTLVVDVVHGEPICRSMQVRQCAGGAQVGRAALGSVPVDRIVRQALASSAMTPTPVTGRFTPSTADEQLQIMSRLRPRRGRKADPVAKQQLIEHVASMYLELVSAGQNHPKPIIAKKLGYSVAHVGTLLRDARAQGLVGAPPGPGRAGSAPAPAVRPPAPARAIDLSRNPSKSGDLDA